MHGRLVGLESNDASAKEHHVPTVRTKKRNGRKTGMIEESSRVDIYTQKYRCVVVQRPIAQSAARTTQSTTLSSDPLQDPLLIVFTELHIRLVSFQEFRNR